MDKGIPHEDGQAAKKIWCSICGGAIPNACASDRGFWMMYCSKEESIR